MRTDMRVWLHRCWKHERERAGLKREARMNKGCVAEVRSFLGIGIREMARRMEVSPSYLSKLERGLDRMTIEFAAKLYEFFQSEQCK